MVGNRHRNLVNNGKTEFPNSFLFTKEQSKSHEVLPKSNFYEEISPCSLGRAYKLMVFLWIMICWSYINVLTSVV